MSNVKFTLPQLDIELFDTFSKDPLLAVAGGREPEQKWLLETAHGRRLFCADKGAAVCFAARLYPEILCGDNDSASAELYELLRKNGTIVHRYPSEKDDTDLQLLLQELPAGDLLCSGVWGGRFDHLYSNVFSLLRYKLKQHNQVVMADEKEIMVLLAAGECVEMKFQQLPYSISLLPLSITTSVDLSGVHWQLENAELEMLHPYAISNVADKKTIRCQCHSGFAGLYCCFEKA